MRKAAKRRAGVQRLNGRWGERAKRGARDVEQRDVVSHLAKSNRGKKIWLMNVDGPKRVVQPVVILLVNVLDSAKWSRCEFAPRSLVHHVALISRTGRLVVVIFPKILSEFGTKALEEESGLGKDGKVSPDARAFLLVLLNAEEKDAEKDERNGQPDD